MQSSSPVRVPALLIFVLLIIHACKQTESAAPEEFMVIKQNAMDAKKSIETVMANSAIKLAPGLKINLWATDSLAPDPVAMSIDDQDRIYLTRTNRQKNSEFDIRGYRHWMTESIALQTPEDRRAFLHKTFAPERSEENKWLPDLNNDSLHDWHDLAIEKEEVWRLEDQDKDGIADISTRIVNDFNDEITDIAGGLLVREKDMFIAVGPDLWRLEDVNGDGIADKKTSISHGYSVHIGFSGHNMSGVIEGPDGKIYWNIGDIGASIVDKNGKKHHHPNEGTILRSNEDGSDFEVFASGLRNTHEFVFDQYGNLISSDNDGDHPGESERLVHVVEGSDAGWRSNWQYGKYTDPKNNNYKVWMDEKLSVPHWEGQAAYIIPPIQNFHNGPTGMVYNPGTALGKDWLNKFFLVEFVGNPASSHIWAFDLKPKGASFELNTDLDMVSGILPTGIRFGADGALYAADWVNGWNTKNYGRVWRIDVADDKNDLKAEREQTSRLIQTKYSGLKEDQLADLLNYQDMRVRLKAQFELVKRGDKGLEVFKKALSQTTYQLTRIHAIWGLGQLISAKADQASILIPYLKDNDSEIVAQIVKVLGDKKVLSTAKDILPLVQAINPRISFFASQSLGRMAYQPAQETIKELIVKNADQDLYIRHAAVLALSRIGDIPGLVSLASQSNKSLKIAGVLALRRLQSPEVKIYLKDNDEYIVTEAARAINDDWSMPDALPALSEILKNKNFKSEPLLRRAINASLRVGTDSALQYLIDFAIDPQRPSPLRAEALSTLGTWASPSVLDRVDGRFRGEIKREDSHLKSKLKAHIKNLLAQQDPIILGATAKMIANLNISDFNADIVTLFKNNKNAELKSLALASLSQLKYQPMDQIIALGMKDNAPEVRATAISLLDKVDISKETLSLTVKSLLNKGSLGEQQELITLLAKLPLEKTESILSGLLDNLKAGKLSAGTKLELTETIEKSGSTPLKEKMASMHAGESLLEKYKTSLEGGSRRSGWWQFNNHTAAQCVKCHSVNGQGSNVGPDLTHIGSQMTREELLQSLVEPSVRLAPGYGVVSLVLKGGQEVFGKLEKENAKELTLITADAEPLIIEVTRIESRKNIPSSMPAMDKKMTAREMRDVVEYLAGLK